MSLECYNVLCPLITPAGLHKACSTPFVTSFHCLVYNRVLSTALHLQTASLGPGMSLVIASSQKAVLVFICLPPPPHSLTLLEMSNLQGEVMQTSLFPARRAWDRRIWLEKLSDLQRKNKKGHSRVAPSITAQNLPPGRRVNRGCDTDQVQARSLGSPCVPD